MGQARGAASLIAEEKDGVELSIFVSIVWR